MTDQPTDRLTDWPTSAWLNDWQMEWMTDCGLAWFTGCVAESLTDRMTEWTNPHSEPSWMPLASRYFDSNHAWFVLLPLCCSTRHPSSHDCRQVNRFTVSIYHSPFEVPFTKKESALATSKRRTLFRVFLWRRGGYIAVPKRHPCWFLKPILWELNTFLV